MVTFTFWKMLCTWVLTVPMEMNSASLISWLFLSVRRILRISCSREVSW